MVPPSREIVCAPRPSPGRLRRGSNCRSPLQFLSVKTASGSMDRLARNAEDLLRIVRELTGRGVSVEFVKNHLTFSGKPDPMGELMLTMLAAFGEFERELIRERQREGIAITKAKGVYKGRKKALAPQQMEE